MRFVAALAQWFYDEVPDEGRAWAENVLRLADAAQPTTARAHTLVTAGILALVLGDREGARSHLEESITIWRTLDDGPHLAYALGWLAQARLPDTTAARTLQEESVALLRQAGSRWGLALALTGFGRILLEADNTAAARHQLNEALALFHELGDRNTIGLTLRNLGQVDLLEGDLAAARRHLEASLSVYRANQDHLNVAPVLAELGWVAHRAGETARALTWFRESLTTSRELGYRLGIAAALDGLAATAVAQGDHHRAARLLGAAERALAGRDQPEPIAARCHAPVEAEVRTALGEEAFAAAWAAGQALSAADAMTEALAPANQSAAPRGMGSGAGQSAPASGLSAREFDVLRLLAAGKSNPEIAETLVLSVHTVIRHANHIFAKLGVQNRTEAAAYAHRHGLV
jgi:non-specific serine/threonine protein kinase